MSGAVAQPWRALWFLYSRGWRNRVLVQLRRLRQPRYIVGALAMLAYLASLLFSPTARGVAVVDPGLLDLRHLLSIAGLTVALGAWWLAAPSDSALAFSNAEVHFLFPAPVSRRTLVQARLFSVQALLLVNVLLWTLLLRRGGGELHGGLRALGLWVLFTTVSLHRLGATLARTHVPDAPRRKPVAKLVALVVLAGIVTGAALAAPQALAIWRSMAVIPATTAGHAIDKLLVARLAVQAILDQPLVHALIWPIRAMTAPAFAHTAGTWLFAMPGALLVLLLHYLWILRDPRPFEELAMGSSARFAERMARMRSGNGTTITVRKSVLRWELPLHGHPAVALIWKNVTAALRTFRPRSVLITVVLVGIVALLAGRGDGSPATLRTTFMTLTLSVFVAAVLTAPAWFRLDLRHDLAHLPFIKTAPLPAHTIVATEILTAALIATVAMTLFFGIPGYLVLRGLGGPVGPAGLVVVVVCGAVALGGVNLLHVTLYNAVALWLPAWVPLNQGGASSGGASVIGQVYITLIAILTALAALLAAPVAAGWGLGILMLKAGAPTLLTVAVTLLSGTTVAALEWLGLARLLGRALDRLEPSDIPSAQT